MRVLVAGGRSYKSRKRVFDVLDRLEHKAEAVICGGASGADTWAAQWAKERGVELMVFPARWEEYGRAAGPIRNQLMLELGRPDLVIVFPGGKGSADMMRRAAAAKLNIRVITT